MMQDSDNKSGYNFKQIILIENDFHRKHAIDYGSPDFKSEISVDTNHAIDGNTVSINFELTFKAGVNRDDQISCKVVMHGMFEKVGETPVSLEDFATINGPAIMFPFVREHIASLTLKAGVTPLLLPPINFLKRSTNK